MSDDLEKKKDFLKVLAQAFIYQKEDIAKYSPHNDAEYEKYKNDPDLGFTPEKPMISCSIFAGREIINSLKTIGGIQLSNKRLFACDSTRMKGKIDCYQLFYTKGFWFFKKTIVVGEVYMCSYCSHSNTKLPKGYRF